MTASDPKRTLSMKCSTSLDHLVRLNDLNREVGDEQGTLYLIPDCLGISEGFMECWD